MLFKHRIDLSFFYIDKCGISFITKISSCIQSYLFYSVIRMDVYNLFIDICDSKYK
jgi:hypothetical protein